MTNSSEIEIATIKNLRAIYFYYVGDESKVLGLRILYDDDKILDYDYRYKYFNDYVSKVLEVYKTEKKKNNIILYSELTEEIVKNFNRKLVKNITFDDEFSFEKLNLYRVDNFSIKDVEEYIKNVILSVMEILTSDKKSVVESIKGYKNKFIAQCTTSKGNILIPFHCIKRSCSSYEFKMYFPDNYVLKSIKGQIVFSDNNVNICWDNYDKTITGQYCYSPLSFEEIIRDGFDQTIYYNNKFNDMSESVKDVVSKYAEIVGVKSDNIVSVNDNNYIVFEEKTRKKDDSVTYKKKTAYISMKKDYVSIVYFYSDGIVKYDGSLDFPFMLEHVETRLIPFDQDGEHYILKEVSVFPTDKMSGLYKKNVNKYSYSVLNVLQNNDLSLPINISEEFSVDVKDMSNILNVKNYVKERKKGV